MRGRTGAAVLRRPASVGVALALALAAAVALSGCTGTDAGATSSTSAATSAATSASTSTAAPTSVPTSRAAVSGLVPVYPADFTEATAATETARVADAIQKLIEPSSIVSVQNVAQKVQADGEYAATYGILRTVALSPTADPIALATSIVGKLRAAGWVQRQTSNTNGTYSTALSSVATGSKGWFIIVVGDSSVAGQPVVSLQLASPDLP